MDQVSYVAEASAGEEQVDQTNDDTSGDCKKTLHENHEPCHAVMSEVIRY